MSAFPLCDLLPGVHWWGLSVIPTLLAFHIVFPPHAWVQEKRS